MHLPIIRKENRYKRSVTGFGGLNLLQSFSPGEMSECSGISHILFPAITQRQRSELVFECKSPSAMIFSGKECIASEDGLYYDRKKVGELSPGKKQLASMGNKIFVFPDKIYYDTEKDEICSLSGLCETYGAKVTFSQDKLTVPEKLYTEERETETMILPSNMEVITYDTVTVYDGEIRANGFRLRRASALTEGMYILEKCNSNQYRIAESVSYLEKSNSYEVRTALITVRNKMEDIFRTLKEGDVVNISGCTDFPENNIEGEIISKTDRSLVFAEGTFTEGTETSSIQIQRRIPDFTCICSFENRIWGCEGNTIYASKLGDATNFFIYKGVSTDSYTVVSNSPGDFTACVSYGSYCLFFKENSCYKLYGNRPSNFQLTESFGYGISSGDFRSIVNADGKLIYKGTGGIFAFYGGLPQSVSDKLGPVLMENAVSGSDGKYYYISADMDGKRCEYVWDIERNLWCVSGITDVLGYASYGGDLYRLTKNGVEKICRETDEEALWSVTLCPFDEGYHKTKNYSRIHITAELFEGAYIKTEMRSDSGIWKTVNTSYGDRRMYLNIPVSIKSCHRVELRLSGKGKCILESVVREFSVN